MSENGTETEGMSQRSNKRPFLEDGSEEEGNIQENLPLNLPDSSDFTVVLQKLASLEKDVNGRYGIDDRLNELEGQVADLTNDLLSTQADNRS